MRSFITFLSLVLLISISSYLMAVDYYCISGSDDNTLKLWYINNAACIRTFTGHTDDVFSVFTGPDDTYVLSGSKDKTLKYWRISNGTCIRTFTGHTDPVVSVAIMNNNTNAVSGGGDEIKVWRISDGVCVRTIQESQGILALAVSRNNRYILSASFDDTVRLWRVSDGVLVRKFVGHTEYVQAVAFSNNNTYAISGSRDKTIKLWDVDTGNLIRTMNAGEMVNSLDISSDNRFALSGSDGFSNNVKYWRLSDGVCVRTFSGHSEWVRSVTFSPDNIYAISSADDNLIKVWIVANGNLYKTLTGHSDFVRSVSNCLGTTGFAFDKDNATLPSKVFSATPNPFRTSLTLNLPYSGAIYTLAGQVVMNLSKGNHSLRTSSWLNGVYIIKCGDDCKRIVKID